MDETAFPAPEQNRPDPAAFGRRIAHGLGINLLVRDVERAARFQQAALGAAVVYWERDFAVLSVAGSSWLLHSDHSYRAHPMRSAVAGLEARGGGVELRLYGVDPDRAEAAVRRLGGTVLSAAADKEHGLREAYLLDEDGYVWVPSVALAGV